MGFIPRSLSYVHVSPHFHFLVSRYFHTSIHYHSSVLPRPRVLSSRPISNPCQPNPSLYPPFAPLHISPPTPTHQVSPETPSIYRHYVSIAQADQGLTSRHARGKRRGERREREDYEGGWMRCNGGSNEGGPMKRKETMVRNAKQEIDPWIWPPAEAFPLSIFGCFWNKEIYS